jgi:glycosyltransferase involved in cell wall biosynthesis
VRILKLIEWNPGRGGAEAWALWLRDALREAGDEVRLLTSAAGTAADGTADYVAPTARRPAARALLQIHDPRAAATVRRAVKEFRPEVAWVNMFAHHLSPSVFRALGPTPVVLFVSDYKLVCPLGSRLLPDGSLCHHQAGLPCLAAGCLSPPHWLRDQLRYAAIHRALRRVHTIVACSAWMQAELKRAGWPSLVLPIPSLPHPTLPRRPAGEPRFLFLGRLDREKGVDLLLEAFARMPTPGSLHLAGVGPCRDALQALVRDLGLDDRVHFLGWLDREAIAQELALAWALVVPSLWAEPLGMVAQEAIAAGVPVIASASGGLAEIVGEGRHGLLFANGDGPALTECLMQIATGADFPEHRLMAGDPEEMVQRFEPGNTLMRWREILATAAAMGGSTGGGSRSQR